MPASSDDIEGNTSANNAEDSDDELHPKRTCTHRVFRFVKFLAVAAAFAMMIGQFVGIAFHLVNPIQYVLRLYMIGFCVVMILNEMEWISFIYQSPLLSNWVSRGVMYSFVGTIGISQYTMETVEGTYSQGFSHAALIYIQVVAWGMVGIGVIYFLMGVFCCQLVYYRVRKDFDQRADWGKRKQRETGKKGSGKRGKKSNINSNPILA